MKKSLWIVSLLLLVCILALSACDGTETPSCNHQYNAVVTPPTKAEDGYTTHTCSLCGDTYTDSVTPAIGSAGLTYNVNSDGQSCTITGFGTCLDTDVIIPKIIDGYTVNAIGEYAFPFNHFCNESLASVTFPDSVTSIGEHAFASCKSLASVTFSDSVTSIGENAFSGCTSLASVTFSDSVTSIGKDAFSGCTSLASVTIPDSVTSI